MKPKYAITMGDYFYQDETYKLESGGIMIVLTENIREAHFFDKKFDAICKVNKIGGKIQGFFLEEEKED